MLLRLFTAAAFLCVPALATGQTPQPTSIEGAWKIMEVTGANASTNSNPQPGLYLFTKKHYSLVLVTGTQGRKVNPPLQDAAKATDAEKLARFEEWQAFAANSGTYEIKGTTLTIHPLVAKNAGVMGPPQTNEFKLEGNTLTLIRNNPPPGTPAMTKLVRVE